MRRNRSSALAALLFAAVSTPAISKPVLDSAAEQPSRPLTILEYRERLATAVAQLRPGATILRVDERTLKIVEEGQTESQINIENGFNSYIADPAALEIIIGRYAKLAMTSEKSTESVDQLVIIVRPSDYLSSLVTSSLAKTSPDKLIAPRPMAGDLSFFLAVDSPETIRTASTDDLERWQLKEAAAWDRAAANIRSRLGEFTVGPIEGQPDSATAIGAESGLAPISCSGENPQGLESQIVLVVSRDAYIFGVPSEPDSMRRFWATAKAFTSGAAHGVLDGVEKRVDAHLRRLGLGLGHARLRTAQHNIAFPTGESCWRVNQSQTSAA
jgi:hypothetical protein